MERDRLSMMTQLGGDGPVDEGYEHLLGADSILGIDIVRDPDPSAHAERLAEDVGGEVVADVEHARRAFAARADAGRVEPVVLDEEQAAELEARASAVEQEGFAEFPELANSDESGDSDGATDPVGSGDPTLTEEAIRALRQLADEVAIAERVRSDTEAAFAQRLTGVSTTADVEPEPAHGTSDASDDADEPPHPELFDEPALEQNRRAAALSIGIVVFFTGGALLLLQAGSAATISLVVFVAGLLVAAALGRRNRVHVREHGSASRDASALLAAAPEDELVEPNDLPLPSPTAESAEPVSSPAVRTASAMHERVLARWRTAWSSLGYEEPPDLVTADEELKRLGASAWLPAKAARGRLQAAQEWSDACATMDRPIVLVEPASWLHDEALETMLNSLPAGAEVMIVEPVSVGGPNAGSSEGD